MFSKAKPRAFCLLRNSTITGFGCFVVCVSKDSPNVKSDITSKKRSKKALLASIGSRDAA